MTEADLNDDLSRAARELGLFWRRVENSAAAGFSDAVLNCRERQRFAFVELKAIPSPNASPRFRTGQLAFAYDASRHGVLTATIAATPVGQILVWDTAAFAQEALARAGDTRGRRPEPLAVVRRPGDALMAALRIDARLLATGS